MELLSSLFILLALLHSSLGSIIRTSPSLDNSNLLLTIQSTKRNNYRYVMDDVASELISQSQSAGGSGDGSGNRVDGPLETTPPVSITEIYPPAGDEQGRKMQRPLSVPPSLLPSPFLQKRTHKNAIPEDTESTSREDPTGSQMSNDVTLRVIPATLPIFNLSPVEAHDQEPDHHGTSIIETSGHFNSTEPFAQSTKHIISEERLMEVTQITVDEQLDESRPPVINDDFLTGKEHGQSVPDTNESSTGPHLNMEHKTISERETSMDSPELPKHPVQYSVFNAMTNHGTSKSGSPCVLGHSPCVGPTHPNGTNLLWDDMRRTLAFAWELHVFGSASLFLLLAGMALLGMTGASSLLHPLCDALTLANGLLLLTGALRAALLLIDPYGTRQILSRPALAALHNMAPQLLLWAQVALALVALRGVRLVLLPLKLQRPWLVGGLAVVHCTLLLVADLISPTLSPALPLSLQTLSLCWGLMFCMGILTQSLSRVQTFLRTPIPQWGAPQRMENRARRLTAVCAFLGVLCCSLQMYSLFWLYGLLGNWRRFGWGWWLCQFWARVLELAWGFSLLVLGSWIFWTPRRSHSRSDHGQGRQEGSEGLEEAGFLSTVLTNIRKGPFGKSEKNWEDLMPNNWARNKLSRAGMSNNIMHPYDNQSAANNPNHKPGPAPSSSCDSQAALLWQRVGERECILSLVEFDMGPPSPINLSLSIDSTLHHGHLGVGSLFTPPPPPWTHFVGADMALVDNAKTTTAPAHVGYRWALDTDCTLTSPDHFRAKESIQPPTDQILQQSPNTEHQGEGQNTVSESGISAITYQEDWSDDEITDL